MPVTRAVSLSDLDHEIGPWSVGPFGQLLRYALEGVPAGLDSHARAAEILDEARFQTMSTKLAVVDGVGLASWVVNNTPTKAREHRLARIWLAASARERISSGLGVTVPELAALMGVAEVSIRRAAKLRPSAPHRGDAPSFGARRNRKLVVAPVAVALARERGVVGL